MDDDPVWPDDDDLTAGERMLLDDLRWCAGRLQQFGPEVSEMRDELAGILSSWTPNPHVYSDGTTVVRVVDPKHHLYAPPHRRRNEEGDTTNGID